jgi:epsilon-lactone hydrolase
VSNPDGRPPLSIAGAPDAIELRHLRAFVAVAEELNFTRAAATLYLSAPALSRQIQALERLVGCALFRRSTHMVELTLAGEALLDGARRVLTEMDGAVATTRSVGGELAGRMNRFWAPAPGTAAAGTELQRLRADYEAMFAQFTPPPEVVVRPVNAGGVPALSLSTDEQPVTVLYLHGGLYVLGSAYGYRPLAGALSVAANAAVLLPDYRLAPENPFPAAIEDTVSAYQWMLEQGVQPASVIFAGESSGAGLVISALLWLREQGLPMPGGSVLFCPGVDLTCAALLDRREDLTPAFDYEHVRRLLDTYLDGHPADDPLVAPLEADLRGLPPMLIQVGTGDTLVGETRRLADRASDHGVDVELELYPVDTHSFQLFWSFLPEAADALGTAGQFIRRRSGAVRVESGAESG